MTLMTVNRVNKVNRITDNNSADQLIFGKLPNQHSTIYIKTKTFNAIFLNSNILQDNDINSHILSNKFSSMRTSSFAEISVLRLLCEPFKSKI